MDLWWKKEPKSLRKIFALGGVNKMFSIILSFLCSGAVIVLLAGFISSKMLYGISAMLVSIGIGYLLYSTFEVSGWRSIEIGLYSISAIFGVLIGTAINPFIKKRMVKVVSNVLSIYDLFLATGAIWLGLLMIISKSGTIFAEPYPESWARNVPIDSWVMLAVLAIVIFGLGNIMAAILSFKKTRHSSWYASTAMGSVFLIGLAYHYMAVGETYLLVSGPFLLFGVVQLCLSLSGCFFISNRPESIVSDYSIKRRD